MFFFIVLAPGMSTSEGQHRFGEKTGQAKLRWFGHERG